jgi:hypothetical protein
MTLDPESASLLVQAQAAAKREAELAAKATATPERVDGEVSFGGHGPSWSARVWAKLTARRDAKPDYSVGVEGVKRWLVAPRRPWWRWW